MIVVTTPTGQVGRGVLQHLVDDGEQVRVVARDPSRIPVSLRNRVDVIEGSHGTAEVLEKALVGADTLLWVVPPYPETDDLVGYYADFTRPAVRAIGASTVQRVVGVSSLGRDVASGAGYLAAAYVAGAYATDDLLESSGASYRALRMPAFMEDVLLELNSIRNEGIFYGAQTGDRKVPAPALADVTRVATTVLEDKTWQGIGSVPVLGPEDLSFVEMATTMTDIIGKTISYVQLSPEDYEQHLVAGGMGRAAARGIVGNQLEASRGTYNVEPRTPLATTPTSFRTWCELVLKPAMLN